MKDKPFSYEEFRTIYSQVPRLCIDLIIRTPEGILLTLRGKGYGWENQWHLPGGTVLYQETVAQATQRLALEETGVTVNIVKLLDYIEFPNEEKEVGFGQSISLAILCDYVSGTMRPDENASQVKAFSVLPDNIITEHKTFLQAHWSEISEGRF